MTEPTLPPQPNENPFKAWAKKFFKENEWIINQLMRGIILLGIAWLGLKLAQVQSQNQSIEHKADIAATQSVAAADKAQAAVIKADAVQTTALKNQVATEKLVVNATGDPKDEKALAESKAALAEHQAATREAAQQK